ncbi:cysteine hydrolase family protein [Chloroflexota bacterium]
MDRDFLRWKASQMARGFTLESDSTALVIIDLLYANASRTEGQGKLAKQRREAASVEYRFSRIENLIIPNLRKLLDFFRENRLRIIYITVGSEMPDYSDILPNKRELHRMSGNTKGNRAHEILDEIKPLPGECVINKLANGAFSSSNVDPVLRAMEIKYMLFTGVGTSNCVEGTFREAVDRGYNCLAVEDCCGDWVKENHEGSMMRFGKMGRVETADNVIKELRDALSKSAQ